MSQQKEHVSQNSRLDKFLFYSKFAMLIIVAILFLIAYSFFQRDLPSSNAHSVYSGHSDAMANGQDNMEPAKVLFVMTSGEYKNDSYMNFHKLSDLINDMPNCAYDLILFDNKTNSLLNNINNDLLVRIYQEKNYQYIVSIGDSAVSISKDVKDLFFPRADIFLYSSSSIKIKNTIPSINSMEEYLEANIYAAKIINHADKFVFLCSGDEYSKYMLQLADRLKSDIEGFEYTVLYAEDYSVYSAASYINKLGDNTSVFYISFDAVDDDVTVENSHVLDILNLKTSTNVYDLSALETSTSINSSLRLWQLARPDEPIAYLGITQENKCAANYEFVEYIAGKIMKKIDNEFDSVSYLVADAMIRMGLEDFPENVAEQLSFCEKKSLLIDGNNLQTGDLVFTSTQKDGAVDGVYVYVSDNIIIDINENGIIAFKKPTTTKYIVAYANPCRLIEKTQN
ncbi:MAG: hypothetical protein AB1Z23_10745 [Eubacteriales bacterium]